MGSFQNDMLLFHFFLFNDRQKSIKYNYKHNLEDRRVGRIINKNLPFQNKTGLQKRKAIIKNKIVILMCIYGIKSSKFYTP